MSRPRILLADDHALVIEGLESLLSPDFEVVGTVHDGIALVEAAQRLQPEVVVTDIGMPKMNGLEAVNQIQKAGANAKVIFLTMHLDVDLVTQGMRLGAAGYVIKNSASHELRTAIDVALEGGTYVSPAVGNGLLQVLTNGAPTKGLEALTSRQREVLQLVAEGHTSREIARLLNVSKTTVEFHKTRVKQVLGVNTIAELIQFAVRSHIVTSPPRPAPTAG